MKDLARISHQISTAAAQTGMSALRSVGFLDVLSSTPAESSRRAGKKTARCAASRRNLARNAANLDAPKSHLSIGAQFLLPLSPDPHHCGQPIHASQSESGATALDPRS
jgi:hypothetical protein